MAIAVIYGVLKNCSYMLSRYRSDRHGHAVRQRAWRVKLNTSGGRETQSVLHDSPPQVKTRRVSRPGQNR